MDNKTRDFTWFPGGKVTTNCPHCMADVEPPTDRTIANILVCPKCGKRIISPAISKDQDT